jgi:hypothetical protein
MTYVGYSAACIKIFLVNLRLSSIRTVGNLVEEASLFDRLAKDGPTMNDGTLFLRICGVLVIFYRDAAVLKEFQN